MALIDSSYTHRDGETRGINYRRWVIAQATLTACLKVKGMRWVVWSCWIYAFLQGVFLFGFGQLMDPSSTVYAFITENLGLFKPIAPMFQGWAEENPRIAIGMTYNLFFYIFTGAIVSTLTLSLVALGMAIPRLITSDLSSRAITIYSSKAVSRLDYCLGKFGGVMLLLTITWLGPMLATWLMGNLMAPKISFFWHTAPALLHSSMFVLAGMVFLGLMALGVSAMTSSPRTATSIWVGVLLLGVVLSGIGLSSKNEWLQYLSFWFDLELLQRWIFNISGDFKELSAEYPGITEGDIFKQMKLRLDITADNVAVAITCLSLLGGAALLTLYKKVKPE